MNQMTLYQDDIYAWSQEQARIIRDLRCRRVDLPNDLDLEHVAEEIEDVGNEQRFAAESNLIQAMIHLIKLVALPDSEAVRHWLKETNAFLSLAARRYRPSMQRAIDVQKLWDHARRTACRELEIDGQAILPLPTEAPFALEDLVTDGVDPRVLANRLSEAVGASASRPDASNRPPA